METYPEIVELCGIPGCGKTTLCNHVSCRSVHDIGNMLNVLQSYRRLSLISKLKQIPYGIICKLLLCFLSFPILPIKHWFLYLNFIKMIVLYGHIRHMKDLKYIVSDHGIVQSFVGLLYNHENALTTRRHNFILSVLNSIQHFKIVLCNVPVNVSVERIRGRNRNYGRLDLINGNEELAKKLTNQKQLFHDVISICSRNQLCIGELNMDNNIEDICSDFLNWILLNKS